MVTGTPDPAVGVPEMTPLAESSTRPLGNWPAVIVQLTAVVAPCSWRAKSPGYGSAPGARTGDGGQPILGKFAIEPETAIIRIGGGSAAGAERNHGTCRTGENRRPRRDQKERYGGGHGVGGDSRRTSPSSNWSKRGGVWLRMKLMLLSFCPACTVSASFWAGLSKADSY